MVDNGNLRTSDLQWNQLEDAIIAMDGHPGLRRELTGFGGPLPRSLPT